MKKAFYCCLLSAIVAALAFWPLSSFADGIIVPPPGVNVAVKYHHVIVNVDHQMATTSIDQVFLNDSDVDSLEGVYIFPLPEGASLSNFSMYVDGEELKAELLNADSARAIYESIVRRRLDPALLEYLGRGMFRARVYPIRAHGEKRITLSYSEVLNYDTEVCRYIYPLSPEKFSSKPLEAVSVTIELKSPDPIKTIYSPSHPISVQKFDDYSAKIVYAEENITPNKDFILYYTVSTDDIGMHVLTHNPPDENGLPGQGFYVLMAAPKQSVAASQVVKKRVIFVLDRSGSMGGQKIQQAKDALKFCVNSLNPDDRFNIIDFSTTVAKFRDNPVLTDAVNVQAALSYIDGLRATGGTNINEALLTALAQLSSDSLSNMIVFLTDGQPTVGETDNERIRQNVKGANTYNARLFVFGVGYDVNTHLLDYLSGDNHGVSTYVRPDENIELAVSSFFSKINNPVLSNLVLDFGSIVVKDFFPRELPDLFKGSQLIQFGRYEGDGHTVITLSGDVNGVYQDFAREANFPAENLANDFIPRLWAIRKVGYLLDEIRLHGESQELVDEIVALAKRYGIITPYTAFLINEDQPPEGTFSDLTAQTGADAFYAATAASGYRNAGNTSGTQSTQVRYVGNKTFFWRRNFWVDSQYREGQPLTILVFGSAEYFECLRNNPELGKYFAIGKNVIVSVGGRAYRVQEKESDAIYEPSHPVRYSLSQNYPNPFNPGTWIVYQVAKPSWIRIKIYNLLGQEIRTLVDGRKQAGSYRVLWDGRDSRGEAVPSGVYFYQLQADGGQWTQMRKMVVVR